jgi:hypothetical protein
MDAITSGATGEPEPLFRLPLSFALWTVAAAVVAGWLALSALHIKDDYRVTHLQGVWLAVADAARNGQLYPPIFDGEHYAGTRYMPMPILLNALAARVVGDPLIGGKLVAAILMAGLLVVAVFVLRRSLCQWPLAVALAATVVATDIGLQAGTTIGGDLLPALLQAAALAMALRGRDRSSMLIAGLLAGIAVASKLTGTWAFLAITTWLIAEREKRPAAIFAATCAGTSAVILGAVQLLTRGGLSQHLLAFSLAGIHGAGSLLRSPNQVLFNLLDHAFGTVVLFPLAVIGALLSGRRHLSVIHIALAYALLLLMVVYADVGTGANQLLDIVVLTALAAGHLAGRATDLTDRRTAPIIVLIVAVSAIWAAGVDVIRTVGFDLRRGAPAGHVGGAPARAATIVASIVHPGEEVLSEDPSIYVALGRRPLIMDPFMLTRMDRAHPQWVDPLIARIVERRFAVVVLVESLENRSIEFWWIDYHFGPRVTKALRDSYVFERRIGRYLLYRPLPVAAGLR